MPTQDELFAKIKNLSETIWEKKASESQVIAWLDNFATSGNGSQDERRLHALYLLSQFMYFGSRQMRELMRVLFRDLYRCPIVEQIRKANNDTTDVNLIHREFQASLDRTLCLVLQW